MDKEWLIDQADIQRKRIDNAENDYLRKLSGTYQRTINKVVGEITAFYAKYDNPTYAQATQYLDVQSAQLVREEAQEQADNVYRGDAAIRKDLVDATKKPRFTRLDELLIAITILYARKGNVEDKGMTEALGNTLKSSYLRNMWTIGRAQGFSPINKQMTDSRIVKILSQTWSGENYSQRLWGNTKKIADIVKRELTLGIQNGSSTQQIARIVRDAAGSSYNAAERLVRTEMTRISTEADMQSYTDNSIDKYVYVATLDDRTSEICGTLDNQSFRIADKQEGINAPPMHPNCRSTTIADIGTDAQQQRRARDAEGKSILVPADMTYSEWKKAVYG